MKCYYHPTLDAVQPCSICRRGLCSSCSHTIKGNVYCQDCLVAGADFAAVANSSRFANYSPGRAALLAVIPGLGAVYNRQYTKAITHFAVFFALWVLADETSGVFALAVLAFYIFMIMDAYRSAQAIIRKRATDPTWQQEDDPNEKINAPLWGGALVLLGILFLLNNLGVASFRFLAEFWPLVLVALGLYLIMDYVRGGKGAAPPARNTHTPSPPLDVPPAAPPQEERQ